MFQSLVPISMAAYLLTSLKVIRKIILTFRAEYFASRSSGFISSTHGALGGVWGRALFGGLVAGVPNCTLSLFWTILGILKYAKQKRLLKSIAHTVIAKAKLKHDLSALIVETRVQKPV